MRYRDLFEGMFKTLRVFAPSSSEFIPFLTCHHSITDFEISAFLNQDSYRLLKFVSDLVSIFDTGCFCFTSQLPSARLGLQAILVTLAHFSHTASQLLIQKIRMISLTTGSVNSL
jgi:hypothetical protein